ncbi:DUF1580 domain-containing protein [Fontivita pretiosa]|uniref:DUF1580 domain-containing protein n=1 Tax=Fontivita pretiosa TaxID=2989684 RepID=UPI003D164374
MIDIETETVLTLAEATRLVPRCNGRRPSIPTLWRWCRRGIKGVRLEYIRVGRNIATSKQAISRFFQTLAAADKPMVGDEPTPRPPGSAQAIRQASIAEANRFLDRIGV